MPFVTIMSSSEWVWIPRISRIALRAEPSHRSEQVSELLWGEPQQIIEVKGGWSLVRGWLDGYLGWTEVGSLWRAYYDGSGWATVRTREAPLFHKNRQVGRVSIGALFPLSGRWHTAIGDFWTPARYLLAWGKSELPLRTFLRAFLGSPYHWGGKSPGGIDCSGLTQIYYRLQGRLLPRDAYQQADFTLPVESPAVGDLVFFTARGKSGISHVGVYVGSGRLLHATPAQGVHIAPIEGLYTHTFHSFRTLLTEDFVI
ncbi:MAG: C40 family peptidase [Bacteroidia bacterium]|nr:C40 family peptidase [Bacteroidia bacterium]